MDEHAEEEQEEILFDYGDGVFERLEEVGYEQLDPVEQVFLCVWMLELEVNNGGFDQYYFNTSGDWAAKTPAALRTIGAARCAEIVEQANAQFGDEGPSPDRETRQQQLDELPESAQELFESLGEELCDYPDDIRGLLVVHIGKG